jgi:iron complex transport system ATP-binding protein
MRVTLEGVGVTIDSTTIVEHIDLVVEPGQMIGLVGPNGSGKSTILRTIYRAIRPVAGLVRLDDDEVWRLSAKKSAQRSAVVAQEASADFDLSVHEVVAMGRSPHKRMLERDSAGDLGIVVDALARVGMGAFADRLFATLSGGEKQRVLVARALAQQTRVLILDEATNHLDISAQLALMDLVSGLGVTVIAALHDLNLAASYCDRICVIDRGAVVAQGPVDEVMTPGLIAGVFGVSAHCGVHPLTGRLLLTFGPLRSPEVETEREPEKALEESATRHTACACMTSEATRSHE